MIESNFLINMMNHGIMFYVSNDGTYIIHKIPTDQNKLNGFLNHKGKLVNNITFNNINDCFLLIKKYLGIEEFEDYERPRIEFEIFAVYYDGTLRNVPLGKVLASTHKESKELGINIVNSMLGEIKGLEIKSIPITLV